LHFTETVNNKNAFEGQHLDKSVVIAGVQEEYRTLVRHVLG
jgi:hypothetical protein